MLTKSRLIVISLFISSALIACGDSSNNTSNEKAATVATNEVSVEVGMSKQSIEDLLGTPTHTQTRSIDALTFTQSEWTDQAGTISVQFHNGKAQFNQFVAAPSQD